MKILHTADLHLESKMESNFSQEQARRRRGELLDAFEAIVDYAQENDVRIILISGDMFDKSSVRKTALNVVLDTVRAHQQIDFIYLRGNHDCEAFESELGGENKPDNIKLFTAKEWRSYDYGDITIIGREINSTNHESLYSDLVLDSGRINIVMLHGQESEYDGKDVTYTVNTRKLSNKYIDYLALGHIHSYKEGILGERGIYCYPGTPEPRGFDECGEKGFVILDIEEGQIHREFISQQKRTFHEIEIEINPSMDMPRIIEVISDKIHDISSLDACKLIICGQRDMDRFIDLERIENKFSDRFFFFKVYDHTVSRVDYESFALDMTLKGSFVRLVGELDIDNTDKSMIIETGIRAIMGEEIL